MNTKNILSTLLVAPALIATISGAQAQRTTRIPGGDTQVPTSGEQNTRPSGSGAALRTTTITQEQMDRGYTLPAARKPITNSTYKPVSLQDKEAEALLEQHGYTFANRSDLWIAKPHSYADLVNHQVQFNQTTPDHKVQTVGYVTSDAYNKTFEVGNRNVLFAQAKFSLTHSGSQNLARLQSDAEINGAVLGDFGNLAKATADFKAPASGTQSAAMNLTVLGQTVWNQNKSGATATINDGFTFTGKILDTKFGHTILGVGIKGELFVEGSVNAHFTGACNPRNVQVNASAGGSLSVGGHADADAIIASAHLVGKVDLVDLLFSGDASTVSSMGPSKIPQQANIPILTIGHHVKDNISFLKGNISIELDFVGKKVGSFSIFDEPNGLFHTAGVLESYDKVYDLVPIVLNKQATR